MDHALDGTSSRHLCARGPGQDGSWLALLPAAPWMSPSPGGCPRLRVSGTPLPRLPPELGRGLQGDKMGRAGLDEGEQGDIRSDCSCWGRCPWPEGRR